MKVGDIVRVTVKDCGGLSGQVGKIVETGQSQSYDWLVRFPDATSDDDTYYFDTDELETVT
jgi:hypothetical protein